MIADTDAVLLAPRCMSFERPRTQDLGAEGQARPLWLYGWLQRPPRTGLVERALGSLDAERGEAA